jgi:hypothetical protein
MRETTLELKNESALFQHLNTLVKSYLNMERVEPTNESGFPDVHFNWRKFGDKPQGPEGTIELKHFKKNEKVSLNSAKMRGNQKAAHLEYYQADGRRRFVMAWHNGNLHVWNTEQAYNAILQRPHGQRLFPLGSLDETDHSERIQFVNWLREVLA